MSQGLGRPGVCVVFIALLSMNSLYLQTSRAASLTERYPGSWQTGVHREITQALVAKNVRGCGEYKYRPSALDRDEYLVYCTADGQTWTAYLVWPKIKEVMGPLTPDPSLR